MAVTSIRGEVHCYPYRTAKVVDRFLTLHRELVHDLELELGRKAGVREDNHVVYQFEDETGKTIYVHFSDSKAYFGTGLHEHRW